MALTESNMLQLGTVAPDFTLIDTVSDKMVSLSDIRSDKATVVIFSCNHCPYVIHVNPEIVRLAKDYQAKGVSFVAISSNDVDKYPADGPEKMKVLAKEELPKIKYQNLDSLVLKINNYLPENPRTEDFKNLIVSLNIRLLNFCVFLMGWWGIYVASWYLIRYFS